MAALGCMQIPLKLVGLRLGLPFISSLSFILFLGFWGFFCQKQRGKIGLIKECVTKDWGSLGFWRSALLKTSFWFNGVEPGDLDQSYIYVELAEVFWLRAMSSAHLRGKPAGVSFCPFVCMVCLCSRQKNMKTGDVPPAKPWGSSLHGKQGLPSHGAKSSPRNKFQFEM